jgi:aminoglycoside phosphotransferase (APT) family kinase protein
MQLSIAGDIGELLALGVPDMRLAVLPERYEALLDELAAVDGDAGDGLEGREEELRRLRAAVPRVAAKCAELAGYGIAETIQHDDLHDGAVYVRNGRYAILDWGDACVSHPFFSMSVTLEGVISWGREDVQNSVDTGPYRDAYLAPFAAGRDMAGLLKAFGLALRLGWVCRAVNGHTPGVDAGPTWTRLRMFLDGHP